MQNLYGQYCPLSMATQLLANRWTLLILRELLEGSTSFNDIGRGVPLMSRSLLSKRLRELEDSSLLTKTSHGKGHPVRYELTKAGSALGPIVRHLAEWGQEWIDAEPSLDDIDTDFLMWDIRRNVRHLEIFPQRFVVHFHFPDAKEGKTNHWLVFEQREVDVCYVDPGFETNVHIEAGLANMTQVWMGWINLEEAIADERLLIIGPTKFTKSIRSWLGLSSVSGVEKQPRSLRVLRRTLTRLSPEQ